MNVNAYVYMWEWKEGVRRGEGLTLLRTTKEGDEGDLNHNFEPRPSAVVEAFLSGLLFALFLSDGGEVVKAKNMALTPGFNAKRPRWLLPLQHLHCYLSLEREPKHMHTFSS
jgi:hypothetical protein